MMDQIILSRFKTCERHNHFSRKAKVEGAFETFGFWKSQICNVRYFFDVKLSFSEKLFLVQKLNAHKTSSIDPFKGVCHVRA